MRDDLLGLELDDTNEGRGWEDDMCVSKVDVVELVDVSS